VLAGAAITFAVLALVFVPLERAFSARSRQRVMRPHWAVDASFFLGQYLIFSSVAIAFLSFVHHALAARVPESALAGWTALPLWLQAAIAVIAGDVLVYWFHRACHRYEFLWRFHAVHHSSEELDWLAAFREHPVDGILTQLCQNLPAMLLGLPMEVLAGLVVLRGSWGVFIHSNVKLSIGPLRYVLGAPELHHWHHAALARTEHNFANLAPWLDVVFGTYHRPEGEETYPLGLREPWPKGYVAQLLRPLVPARWLHQPRHQPVTDFT
jgi:sterol desaturase/sphingolipid hydroxylase (fatty acid hydroxylase superfamily)